MTTTVTVLVIAVLVVFLGVTTYLYLKDKTLDDIRADVYALILEAEHRYTESGKGKEKMDWVLTMAMELLPDWATLFITREVLEKVVQVWFEAVKDLLDDGKYNKSCQEDDV